MVRGAIEDILLLEDLKSLVVDLKAIPTYGKPPAAVKVVDVITGKATEYPTKRAAVKALKCDREVVKRGRTTLYKKRYDITMLNEVD